VGGRRMIRLCQIGCGEHALGSHGPCQARYAAAHPGALELVACADLDPGRAESYRARFAFARAYADPFAMIVAERPHAVVLVVPVERTCEMGAALLERGVPVLMEKPPGRTVAEVDRLIAAAGAGGGSGPPVPHQVAFNRRYAPLVRELRRRIESAPEPPQHLRYTMVRFDRRDPDFSITAIHGIDAVRYLAGCDYAEVRFRYQELPRLGPGVANLFLDAVMASGATAHLSFCPVAGVVVERAEVHLHDHTFLLEVPMWAAFDAPGRLQHLERGALREEILGRAGSAPFEQGGFEAELAAFLDDLQAARFPSPDLRAARQSVAVAEAMRARAGRFG